MIACKQWHSIDYDVMNWRRVEIIEEGIFPHLKVSFLSISCLHCESPACMSSCPTSAIFKRKEDGVVLVEAQKCLGEPSCGLCKEACPYNIPQFNPYNEFRMEKCDLCHSRIKQGKNPICVDACPTNALKVSSLENLVRREGCSKKAEGFNYFEDVKPSITFGDIK